jgi:hypothetical protein
MTPRTPYFQAYYQEHKDEMRMKYKRRKYTQKTHGVETLSPGLYRLWVRDGDAIREAGDIVWTGTLYTCDAGSYTTKRAAVVAMMRGLKG